MNKRTSIKDIATRLKTSTATVSYVLSGKGKEKRISAAMQKSILKAAADLNYRKNTLASGLKLGNTHTIGLIVSNISDFFYAKLAHAVEVEAAKHGYTLIVCSSEDDQQKEDTLIGMLKGKCVDGIILSTAKKDPASIIALRKENFPLVLVDRYYADMPVASVVVDNLGGSYELVKHMIACGNRKIGVISTENHLLVIKHRIDGYRKAMKEAGIRINSNWIKIINLKNQDQEIVDAIDQLMTPPDRVEAVFCLTNFLAVKVYSILKSKGLRIPNSLGVACFDHFDYFDALDPSLTSVAQPIDDEGREAVRLLVKQIENGPVSEHIVLPTKLVIGKSC